MRKHQYRDSGVKLLNVGNINSNKLDLSTTERFVSSEEANGRYSHFLVDEGDLLIASSGIAVDNFHSKIAFAERQHLPLCMNTSTIRFKPLDDDRLDINFFRYFLATPYFTRQLSRLITGSAQLNFGPSHLKQMLVPLPPLAEQRRIAGILDAADAIRRKREQAIGLTEQFLRSTFLDMFGDPVTNPKGWPQFTFDDRLTMVQYGPRFFNEAYTKNGVRIVRISDLDFDGNLNYETMPIFDADEDARKDFCLHPGDLLLARTGATVGKTALIEADAPPSIAGAYFIRLRFQADILPLYAQMILRSKSMQAIIAQKSKQSAQPNFNGPGIRRLPMPLPPLALQQKFEQVHQQATCTLRKRKRDAVTTDNLFNSLVQRAFRGEL